MTDHPSATEPALDALLRACRPLVDAFSTANHQLFLVGGVVRDHMRGIDIAELDDVDLTTDAPPKQIKALLRPLADAMWTQGERFGTIGAQIGGVAYEITTHRAEVYDPDSRKPEVAFGDRIEDDLARRDFTVNAMARRLPDGELVDPFGGAADLAARRLDTPLDPEVSFSDDPLRMLRAARFAARAELVPVPRVEAAIGGMLDRLAIVADERIRVELLKLYGASDPLPGLALMRRTGLDVTIAPELGAVDLDTVAALPPDAETRLSYIWAGLGSEGVASAARRLKMSNSEVASAKIVETGLELAVGGDVDASMARRFAHRVGVHRERALTVLGASDPARAEQLVAAIDAIDEDLTDWAPPLDGDAIMALLNIEPGREVGQAAKVLLEHRFTHGPLDKEAAKALLVDWYAEQ